MVKSHGSACKVFILKALVYNSIFSHMFCSFPVKFWGAMREVVVSTLLPICDFYVLYVGSVCLA